MQNDIKQSNIIGLLNDISDAQYYSEQDVVWNILQNNNKIFNLISNTQYDCDSSIFQEYYIMESSDDTSQHKNIFKSIWKTILKILTWVKDQFLRLVRLMQNIFNIKNIKATADQVCEKLHLKRKKSVNENKKTISMDVEHGNTIKQEDIVIDDVVKPLLLEITGNNSICIRPSNVYFDGLIIDTKVAGNRKVLTPSAIITAYYLLSNKGNLFLESLDVFIDKISKGEDFDKIDKILKNEINSYNSYFTKYKYLFFTKSFNIKQDVVIEFQKKINDYLIRLKTIEYSKFEDKQELFQSLLNISNILFGAQLGLNTIASSMKKIYTIDGCYFDTVDDINILSNFVKELITAGVPSKYIAYNSFLISNDNLKGRANIKRPLMGQTRLVFRPNKLYVYKIALNGSGIDSNRNEQTVSKDLEKDSEIVKLIAPVFDVTDGSVIIKMKNIISNGNKPSKYQRDMMVNKLNDYCKSQKLGYYIIDIHVNNALLDMDNNPVIIDYGAISFKPQNGRFKIKTSED